jgi:succinate-acetate transporter protein
MATTGEEPRAPFHTRHYEFSENENQIIENLASKMNFLGLAILVFGIVVLLAGVIHFHPGLIFGSIIFLTTGIFAISASQSFRNVVETKGDDINHLMSALDHLRKAVTVGYWIFVVGLLSVIVLALLSVMKIAMMPI